MLCSLRAFSRKIYGSMREAQRRIALIQADLDDQARLEEVLAGKEWKVFPQVSGHIPGALDIDGDIAVLHDRLTSDVFQSVLKAASSSNRQPILAHKTLPSMSDDSTLSQILAFGRPYNIATLAAQQSFLNEMSAGQDVSSQNALDGGSGLPHSSASAAPRTTPDCQTDPEPLRGAAPPASWSHQERPAHGNTSNRRYLERKVVSKRVYDLSDASSDSDGQHSDIKSTKTPRIWADRLRSGAENRMAKIQAKKKKKGKKGAKLKKAREAKQEAQSDPSCSPYRSLDKHEAQLDDQLHSKTSRKPAPVSARRRQQGSLPRKSQPGDVPAPQIKLDDMSFKRSEKAIILFDLNGTLTSHTVQRYSAGVNKMRPGLHHLRRLQAKFKLGLYSSATDFTVKAVLPMLEEAAGDGPQLFQNPELVLHRGHTQLAPQHHIDSGGRNWDTVKPLARYFRQMHRILLVDDDAYKALEEERQNMILVPCWQESESDTCIQRFVDAVLGALDGIDAHTDVRNYSQAISDSVRTDQQARSVRSDTPSQSQHDTDEQLASLSL